MDDHEKLLLLLTTTTTTHHNHVEILALTLNIGLGTCNLPNLTDRVFNRVLRAG